MNYEQGIETIVNRSSAFHDRYFRAYGQLIQRLDDGTYLMSRDNLMLQEINADDIDAYDAGTGDIGAIFKARKELNAMVFACTEAAVAFSRDNDEMKPALDDLAMIVGTSVRVAESGSSADLIPALRDRLGCFVRGTGIFAVGRDIEEAIAAARILEKSAEAEIYGQQIGGLHYLEYEEAKVLNDRYISTYSSINDEQHVDLLSYDEYEFRLRSDMIDTGKQMCRDDLVQGTWGNLSVRLNDHEMLVTPSGMDYFKIGIEDIVKMDYLTEEYDRSQRKPTSEFMLHAELYRRFPDAGAIIHTHSNGCCVFAAARKGFRIDQPELSEVIGDLNVSGYQTPGTKELVPLVMDAIEGSRACIMANHGAMFYGKDLEVVLAIANAVESKACNLLGFGSILIGDADEESE